jgi:hypothetical protein
VSAAGLHGECVIFVVEHVPVESQSELHIRPEPV